MPDEGITFDASDLEQFGKDLTDAQRRLGKERAKSHRQVADLVVRQSHAKAAGMGGQVAHFASAIRPRATTKTARVAVVATSKRNAGALAAIWGTKKEHTGWMAGWVGPGKGKSGPSYINPRKAAGYANSPRNTLPWVGSNWQVGEKGEGPRAINEAIADSQNRIDDLYLRGNEAAWRRAFPGGFQ